MSETLAVSIPEVDAVQFAAALANHSLPLLVAYTADHCIWCSRIEPVLVSALQKFEGRLRSVKVNITLHPSAAPGGGVRATPTVALYRNGSLVMSKSGMMQRAQLDSFLEHWLDPANEGLG